MFSLSYQTLLFVLKHNQHVVVFLPVVVKLCDESDAYLSFEGNVLILLLPDNNVFNDFRHL